MNPIRPFATARLPRIVFGDGALGRLADEAAAFGRSALLVTGARSFAASPRWRRLTDQLTDRGMTWGRIAVEGEPSPDLVDGAVREYGGASVDVVIGIGGGSAVDAAKAIAGLLRPGNSVLDHLEGVGAGRPYKGPAVPLIAVPTTAGTGSEATKNAVLSRRGAEGFKKSFRDEQLVARVALVDPSLLEGAPRSLVAANGMDAFTQLLEGFVSTNANPMTDALAWSGIEAFVDGFFPAWDGLSADAAEGRSRLAYAALMSGIVLAQTGLGSVHGLASPLGAYFPIPHGLVCGTLVAEATEVNIHALEAREPDSLALDKYARVGERLAGHEVHHRGEALAGLVDTLRRWQTELGLATLSEYGVTEADIPRLVADSRGSSMKTNPLVLTDDEIAEVLRRRL